MKELLEKNLPQKINKITPLTGGDINEVFKITTSDQKYVLKVNSKKAFPNMFKREKQGLELLAKSGIRTPKPIAIFEDEDRQYLVLEFIDEESPHADFWNKFAEDLVTLHKTDEQYFGLTKNNYIGSIVKKNTLKPTWETFFIENRVLPLVKKAFDIKILNSNHLRQFETFYKNLNGILPKEKPSLIHGDLWGGNLMKGKNQTPVFIDPAVYFGHREMDIAMTQLFGGFNKIYLERYQDVFPLEKGWEKRLEIHNLYPNLVHLILFGGGYLSSIVRLISKF